MKSVELLQGYNPVGRRVDLSASPESAFEKLEKEDWKKFLIHIIYFFFFLSTDVTKGGNNSDSSEYDPLVFELCWLLV